MRGAREQLILFLKDPNSRPVKTRLAAGLGPGAKGMALARRAYRAMIADLLGNLRPLAVQPFLQGAPGAASPGAPLGTAEASPALERNGFPLKGPGLGKPRWQQGCDLGERMADAFRRTFAGGAERALLIGSDIPQLGAALMKDYFRRLGDYPLVLGPAADGGYYLIGFRAGGFREEIFSGISWGTEQVFQQTLRRARSLGLRYFAGIRLRDIDTVQDLKAVLEDSAWRGKLPALKRLFQAKELSSVKI